MKKAFALLAALTVAIGPASFDPCHGGAAHAAGYACCKVCKAGKACGDSCIARDKVCNKGPGCACDG